MRKLAISALIIMAIFSSEQADARDQIRAVGSSTVYPFATVVAEEFGKKTKFKTPVIESTGTGGGFKLFCSGVDEKYPDISNASRAIKDSEVQECAKNSVKNIIEIKIGYDGLVIANSVKAEKYDLTKEQIFLALAKQVPRNGKLVDNFYQKWNEIDSSLPDEKIAIYGPPPTSGTRDSFNELVMAKGCEEFKEFGVVYSDPKDLEKKCQLIREDGKYIEAGENDNLIVQKLNANPHSLGIFGYSFLDQNRSTVQASKIKGVEPEFENISSGKYSIARPLFVYVKGEHIGKIPGLKEFAEEFASDAAIGEEGYLAERGLVPLPPEKLKDVQNNVDKIK